MEKKVLIFLTLIIIISGGVYWYFNFVQKDNIIETSEEIPGKEKLEASDAFKEWLNSSLKAEFLPPRLDLVSGVDIGEGFTRDKNTYGYNWHYPDKHFYTAVDYNNNKPGIDAYVLSIFWDEKIDLDQKTAQEILENYFNLLISDLKCGKEKLNEAIINFCYSSWKDEKENWQNLSIAFRHQGETNTVLLVYYLTPLESENYGPLF